MEALFFVLWGHITFDVMIGLMMGAALDSTYCAMRDNGAGLDD